MATIKNYLWPYDEVQITQTENGLRFQAPWVKVSYPRAVDKEKFDRCMEILEKGPQSAVDIQLMDSMMRPLAKYPIFYCLPHPSKTVDPELRDHKTSVDAKSLRWDTAGFLNFSQAVENYFDGVSILTCMRQSHLNDLIKKTTSNQEATKLTDLDGNELRKATLLFLRQNHYVTEKCEEVLTPAVELHSAASEKVREFIKEESGHDRLLGHSFKELGENPKDTAVLPSLVKVMEHFKKAAETNLLAFCFIIDMFERSSAPEKNPMVQALHKMGEVKAAKPIEAHSHINVHGDHDNESFEILGTLGLLPKSYIIEGVLLAQQASDLMLLFIEERQAVLEKLAAAH